MNRCPKCNKFICKCKDFSDKQTSIQHSYLESLFLCPEKISTPVFASPYSALSEAQLNELRLCIEAANNLLRSLGSQSDPENTRQLQLHFLELQGIGVTVKIKCKLEERKKQIAKRKKSTKVIKKQLIDTIIEKKGLLGTTGRDFLQLNTMEGCIFILFERLISLSRTNSQEQTHKIEQMTNKDLVLNFGDYVSKRPELVNLFFGIPLCKLLQYYTGAHIQVKTDNKIVSGKLFLVNESNIQVMNTRRKSSINFGDICFIELINM